MVAEVDRTHAVEVPAGSVSLSTSSAYPESTAAAFELAARLGYDGVEVMVGTDTISTDIDAVGELSEQHGIPVVSVHAPCLLITQRVWGTDPWAKLVKSAEMAHQLNSDLVVVHPPFRWQREYGRAFVTGIADLEQETGMVFAVENMYPWRAGRRSFQAYVPSWDVVDEAYDHVTLDVSHTATAGVDAVTMAEELGSRLSHIHLADGLGSGRDEHLVPGRGSQRCADLLELLAERAYAGHIVVEINTRRSEDRDARETDLAAALAYARLHFATSAHDAEGN